MPIRRFNDFDWTSTLLHTLDCGKSVQDYETVQATQATDHSAFGDAASSGCSFAQRSLRLLLAYVPRARALGSFGTTTKTATSTH